MEHSLLQWNLVLTKSKIIFINYPIFPNLWASLYLPGLLVTNLWMFSTSGSILTFCVARVQNSSWKHSSGSRVEVRVSREVSLIFSKYRDFKFTCMTLPGLLLLLSFLFLTTKAQQKHQEAWELPDQSPEVLKKLKLSTMTFSDLSSCEGQKSCCAGCNSDGYRGFWDGGERREEENH